MESMRAQHGHGRHAHSDDRGIGLLSADGQRHRCGGEGNGGGNRQGTGQPLPQGNQDAPGYGQGDEAPRLVYLPAGHVEEVCEAPAHPEPAQWVEGGQALVVHVRIGTGFRGAGQELGAENLVYLDAVEPQAGGRKGEADTGQREQRWGDITHSGGEPRPPAGARGGANHPPHA